MDKNPENPAPSWNSSYSLNIPLIDKQHMKFFQLFDNLLALHKQNESYERIYTVIEELEKYTNAHFQMEEALMRHSNVPDYELHLVQHKLFITKVEEFKFAHKYKNAVLAEQMINFMRKWFLVHISEIDGKYVENVQEYLHEQKRRAQKKSTATI